MEPLSFLPVTLASVLATLTNPNATEHQVQISTHVSPEIAGLWELDINSIPDIDGDIVLFSAPKSNNDKVVAEPKWRVDSLKNVEKLNDKTLTIHQNKTIRFKQASKPQISCKERYNFAADNELITTSGQEWIYSEYIYQHQLYGLPVIAINTIYDNSKPDCSGTNIDQTGETMIAFVDYRPKDNEMRWCIDPQGKQCFMTFHKLNP